MPKTPFIRHFCVLACISGQVHAQATAPPVPQTSRNFAKPTRTMKTSGSLFRLCQGLPSRITRVIAHPGSTTAG